MECMRPLSMLALSRLDMARTVQLRRALRLELAHLRPPSLHFSSVASSEQSFSKFMNNVKYLQRIRNSYSTIKNPYSNQGQAETHIAPLKIPTPTKAKQKLI